MSELEGLYGIWLREFKVFQREKSRVISSIAQPIIWLFLLGGGIGGAVNEVTVPGGNYQRFIYPGIVAMSAMFSTVFFGLYIVWDRKIDVLKEILVAPISRVTVFFGKVIGGGTETMITATIILVLGIGIAQIPPLNALAGLVFVGLLAIGMISIGLTLGAFLDSMEGFQVIVTFMVFPLFFLSGALFNIGTADGAMALGISLNPISYAVDGLRGVTIGYNYFPLWLDFAVIGAFDVIMVLIGTWAFRRMKL
jgi:ABC-2 type transport system permease protein